MCRDNDDDWFTRALLHPSWCWTTQQQRRATPPPPFSFNHRVVIIKGFHNSHRDGAGAASRIHCSSPSHLSSFLSSLSRHFHSSLSAKLLSRSSTSDKSMKDYIVGWGREIELKAPQKSFIPWKLHREILVAFFALRWSDIKDSRQQKRASQHTMKKRAPSYMVHEYFSFIAAAAKVIKSEDFKECS